MALGSHTQMDQDQPRGCVSGVTPAGLILPNAAPNAPMNGAGPEGYQKKQGAASSSSSWQKGQEAVDSVMEEVIRLDNASGGPAGIAVVTTRSGAE